jgi:putative endopeptidase
VGLAEAAMGEAIGRVYVERHIPPAAKEAMDVLVANLIEAYRQSIAELEWMSPETRERAHAKLAAFTPKIGYPVKWKDYSALEIDPTDVVGNIRRSHVVEHDRQLDKIGKPIDRDEWYMTPQTVNAYYNPLMNEIVFPAGILQPPFFYPDADEATNYGAIGLVIGHEMSHGFDDAGSRYDANGNLKEWWTPQDRKAYEARQDLVVRQYEEYEPLPGLHINGKLTLGENIGDIGGLRIAWAAFQRMLARKGPPKPIDGFTAEQRFFLGYAQSWRNKLRDEALRVRLNVDPHSPGYYRVMGTLSNDPSFHEAFGCGAGSKWWRPEEVRPTVW